VIEFGILPGKVRGSLFVDYVRMMRGNKDVEWSRHLSTDDLAYLGARIVPSDWYPMETFERMGNAILAEVAQGDLNLVAMWGAASVDWLAQLHNGLLVPGDPRESLMRFQVVRSAFFDYPAIELDEVDDHHANARVGFGMGKMAEEAASNQALGFFSRLVELAGAPERHVVFTSKSWEGAPATHIAMRWNRP
jgi:hypothetical protein